VSSVGTTFPLVSRRRLIGLAWGAMHGARRGSGSDVAGSRPYTAGDDPDRIDWATSARISSARNTDEFVVREYFADESPRVVLVTDRRRAMTATPDWVPWLCKSDAIETAAMLIEESVAEARGLMGFLEFSDDADAGVGWCPPGSSRRNRALVNEVVPEGGGIGEDRSGVAAAFAFLALHRRAVPSASFVFVLSDFLDPPPLASWEWALDRGWDVVPVVIQDPVWEQSFPDVDGVVLPLVGPDGEHRLVRLRRGESARYRELHDERRRALLEGLSSLGITPVLVSDAGVPHVLDAFLAWSTERQASWGAAA
jgi:uncharacterized protein (DUF58 family)